MITSTVIYDPTQPTTRYPGEQLRLRTFYSSVGYAPAAGLVLKHGKLFGTTTEGAASHGGMLFELYPISHHLDVLHTFSGGADGAFPYGDLTADPATQSAAFYGTTLNSETGVNHGTVFKINALTKTLTTLHAFVGPDGSNPVGGLVIDTFGALYGTAGGGIVRGACRSIKFNLRGCGVVFEVVP